ncbi:unnamed protein product, partial [marine sediment metagenome]
MIDIFYYLLGKCGTTRDNSSGSDILNYGSGNGSYNVSAIRVLENIGVESLLHRLKKLGFETLDKGADYYGLGLTLGGGEVTLLELARAYGALARSGVLKKEKLFLEIKDIQDRTKSFPKGSSRRVFSPEVSYIITNILQ